MKKSNKFLLSLPKEIQKKENYPINIIKLLSFDMKNSNTAYKLSQCSFYNSLYFGCFSFNKPISKCLKDEQYQK